MEMTNREILRDVIDNMKNSDGGVSQEQWIVILLTSIANSLEILADTLTDKKNNNNEITNDENVNKKLEILNNLEEPLDYEISELVKLINCVDGIRTTESCFGHNISPIHIYGIADSIADLNKFKYKYLYCNDMWQIELILTDKTIDDNEWDKVEFVLKTNELYFEFPITQLLATNLTMSMKEKLRRNKEWEY